MRFPLHPSRSAKLLTLLAVVVGPMVTACAAPATTPAARSAAQSPVTAKQPAGSQYQLTAQHVPVPTHLTHSPAPDYRPISDHPTTEKGLDFGFLTKVTVKGDQVTLTVNRAIFLDAEQSAQRHHGVYPPDDYEVIDNSPRLRTFVLDVRAPLVAENQLRTDPGQVGEQTLTRAQFVKTARRALRAGQPGIWMRHAGGPDGTVTALLEQYRP